MIITGRREAVLQAAKKQSPKLEYRVSDAASVSARVELVHWITENFPRLNVLVMHLFVLALRVNYVTG